LGQLMRPLRWNKIILLKYLSKKPLNCYKFLTFFRLLWPCVMNTGWRVRNQLDATNLMFIIKLLSQHVWGIIMPSSGELDCALPRMVFCTGCDGCGCVELSNSNFHSASSSRSSSTQPQPAQPVIIPYAAVPSLVLLMMA